MRILVGNNRLGNPGGSETFTYAFVEALLKKGHDVQCITLSDGIVSKAIEKLGVSVWVDRSPIDTFDVAFLSHTTSILLARKIRAFKVQTCHGIFPALEQPVPGMDAYVSISDEVYSHLIRRGIVSHVILNGVDCTRFYPENPIHPQLQTVLSLVHSDEANAILKHASQILGFDLLIQNKYSSPIWAVEDLINEADLVVGLGRGIYEAIACGRNAVIFDYRSYMKTKYPIGDGFVTAENITDFLKNNCSGRFSNEVYSDTELVAEMEHYDIFTGMTLRDYAIEHLNIDKQVDRYLDLVQ